jgi:hypothetical protein
LRGGQRKTLKEELENNSRKQRDLTKNRHCDSLKEGPLALYLGKIKKGDDVADDGNVEGQLTLYHGR